MEIVYRIHRLEGLVEAELGSVAFELLERCPVCGGDGLADLSVLRDSLVTSWCGTCGHLFHRRRPDRRWLEHWYRSSWETRVTHLGSRSALALTEAPRGRRSVFYFCQPMLERGFKVLDVGCGYGEDLLPFKEFGCAVFGVEPSPHRARSAAGAGIPTANVAVDEVDRETFGVEFDLIIANHVLEHVPDVRRFVEVLEGVLKPRGWMCLSVPNLANSFLLQDFFSGLHVHCFSRSSLSRLLGERDLLPHRFLEEHQLRVLVCREPDAPPLRGLFDPPASHPIPSSWVFLNTIGTDDERYGGEPRVFRWRASRQPLRHAYEVSFEAEADGDHDRVLELAGTGERTLPLRFSKPDGGSAPFWVK